MYQILEPHVNQVLVGQTTTFEAEIILSVGKKYLSINLISNFDVNTQVIGFYAFNTDVTDRKRAEAASILEECNHIVREIHDTLAQAFTGIIIHARSASNKVTSAPEKAQTLRPQILGLTRSSLAEARRSVLN